VNKQKSSLQRILNKGKEKVKVNEKTAELLPVLAQNDHAKMASIIAKWLDEDNQT